MQKKQMEGNMTLPGHVGAAALQAILDAGNFKLLEGGIAQDIQIIQGFQNNVSTYGSAIYWKTLDWKRSQRQAVETGVKAYMDQFLKFHVFNNTEQAAWECSWWLGWGDLVWVLGCASACVCACVCVPLQAMIELTSFKIYIRQQPLVKADKSEQLAIPSANHVVKSRLEAHLDLAHLDLLMKNTKLPPKTLFNRSTHSAAPGPIVNILLAGRTLCW